MEGVFCCKLTFPHPHSGWFYVSHALRTQLTKVNNNNKKYLIQSKNKDFLYHFYKFLNCYLLKGIKSFSIYKL